MRIAFVGKGGAGKTTLSSLFTRFLAAQGKPVLAIDADINQHLGQALGFPAQALASQPSLGNEATALKEYVAGINPRVNPKEIIKTTPPGSGSRLIRFSESNPVSSHFEREYVGIRFMATGPFINEDLGQRCYHSKTGAVELFLNHLIDGPGEYVVIDMTAGADAFASGLFTRFDLTIVVVEPTEKSLSVFRQYVKYAQGFDVRVMAMGNKTLDEADELYLRSQIGTAFLGSFPHSSFVRAAERGAIQSISALEPAGMAVLQEVKGKLDCSLRNWQKLYDQALQFHKQNTAGWANAQYGKDLAEQIDPDFNIETAVAGA